MSDTSIHSHKQTNEVKAVCFNCIDCLLGIVELLLKVLGKGVEELEGLLPVLVLHGLAVDAESKVLGHDAGLDGLNAGSLESGAEVVEILVLVELGTVSETTGPGEDGGNGVGGGLLALAPGVIVASDSAVGSLGLNSLAVRADKNGGHETERTIALSNGVGLDITIVVLAGPAEATVGLHGVGDHVVDEAVLIPDAGSLELLSVVLLVDLLEDVLEATVVGLENGVLGGHVEGNAAGEGVYHGGVGKVNDGLVNVEHTHGHTSGLEVVDVPSLRGRTISGGVDELDLARGGDADVLALVLVTKGVASNNDGLVPGGHETGNVLGENGLTENGATENVADGAVGGEPHLLEVELLNAGLIGGDGGTLDTDVVLLDGLGSLKGNLVVSSITVLDGKIVVLDVDIKVRKDELVLDGLPDDASHFVTCDAMVRMEEKK